MAATGLKSYILNNNLKSGLLLAGFPVLLVLIAFALELVLMGMGYLPSAGSLGGDLRSAAAMLAVSAPLALLVAAVWFVVAYWSQGTIIAAATGAKPVSRADEPVLYNLLENLAISRGLKTPSLYVVETRALNAYASGVDPDRSAVTVTRGLVEALDRDELEAVLGHELTHILNRDTRLMVVCAVFAGIITLVSEILWRAVRYSDFRSRRRENRKGGGLLIVVALALVAVGYVLSVLLRFALSRKREFLADAGSVELTKDPDAMIRALRKIDGRSDLSAPEQVRPLFFDDRPRGFSALMSTHPPIAARIEALVKYAGGRVEATTTAVPTT